MLTTVLAASEVIATPDPPEEGDATPTQIPLLLTSGTAIVEEPNPGGPDTIFLTAATRTSLSLDLLDPDDIITSADTEIDVLVLTAGSISPDPEE